MSTYYVDLLGDDGTGDGSSGNPWATLAHAYDNSIAGDTLHLNAGTHTWVTDTLNDRIIEGDSSETTILDAGGTSALVWWAIRDLTVNDITFTNNGGWPSWAGQAVGLFYGISGSGAAPATFSRCVFHEFRVDSSGNPVNAVGMFGLRLSPTFISCSFYDIASIGTYGNGYFMLGRFTNDQVMTMINCTVDFSPAGGNPMTQFVFENNSDVQVDLTNTIVNNRTGSSMEIARDGGTADNCCFYDLSSIYVVQTDCIYDDPLLIDPENGDLRLQQDSPCIDAGTII